MLEELVNKLNAQIGLLTQHFEVILIDDGSPDGSWQKINELCLQQKHVKGIRFKQNFGQHQAIKAGIDHASGNWVVVIDCDMQDRPEDIPALYNTAQNGYDAVFALRKKIYQSQLQKACSVMFYTTLQALTGIRMQCNIANFGIYKKHIIDAVKTGSYVYFFFPLAVRSYPMHATNMEVLHAKRHSGKTTYSLRKAAALACKIILANSVFSFLMKRRQKPYSIASTIHICYDSL